MAEAAEPVSSLELAGQELADRHSLSRQRAAPIGLLQDMKSAEKWLEEVRQACRRPDPEAAKAAEWLLDNDYHVSRALRQVAKGVPPGFYRRLPALADEGYSGPRIFHLAHELLLASRLQISLSHAERFVRAYQRRHSLSIAELWAFPTMLRIACIEILAAALAQVLEDRSKVGFPVSRYAAHSHSLESTDRIARSIVTLAELASIPWDEFFEHTSHVEEILRRDPSRTYRMMDFETRDRYRTVIEEIACWADASEIDVAREAIAKASSRGTEDVAHHVGYWLLDQGRRELEWHFAARPDARRKLKRALLATPGPVFAVLMALSGLFCAVLPVLYLAQVGASIEGWIAAILLSQIPASILAITIVHWLITKFTEPRVLPKLESKDGLTPDMPTTIIVPAVIASRDEVGSITARLEMHWLSATDAQLNVALLADLADAQRAELPEDKDIIGALEQKIGQLNARYGKESHRPFHLLMRPRLFNNSQNCWMAWERKRGKIEQFNRMVIEGDRTPFCIVLGDTAALERTRFVITVDADTILPAGSVAKLVGTLAHPLNQAAFDETSRVIRGYTLIQPRVEISPSSVEKSLFARLFTGETAIDIYSRAVSDVYQDLFGRGIFVGKGIYDLSGFHRSVDGRVPENAILSHDLFEGVLGRAGLATDIVLYEDFPETYSQFAKRLHRWIRGDWQLLPWIGRKVPGSGHTKIRTPIGALGRWQILDNLRRSLVAPGLVLLAIAGWLILPGSPWFWTLLVLLAPAGQLFIDLVTGLARGRRLKVAIGFWRRLSDQAGRWLLVIAFMLHEAALSLDAIFRTLWRIYISQSNLLEWTSAAHVTQAHQTGRDRARVWQQMAYAPPLAASIGLATFLLRPEALWPAMILLVPWALAPEIALLIERPKRKRTDNKAKLDTPYLMRLARKTWLYFETFAGPSDNWLPPDNYQGPPHEEIGHRTSPTNIGMLLLSTASAWDLGFIGRAELVARSKNVLESLERLERYRGHFLNWYETHHLRPLEPRYVSTVDSGNLAASFIAFAHSLRDAGTRKTLEEQRWEGLKVVADLIAEHSAGLDKSGAFTKLLGELCERAQRHHEGSSELLCKLRNLCHHDLPRVEEAGTKIMDTAARAMPEQVRDLNVWLDRLHHHLHTMLNDAEQDQAHGDALRALADEFDALAWNMDFSWLYDTERRLFSIGYNVSTAKIDPHHYDLLASEARIASFFAIAKRDVATEHWFHLGRPVTRANEGVALVSWNGSMFEYLMPRLLMPGAPETLLGESDRVAVSIHQNHGKQANTPWGISESAFSARDPEHRFRYQAFGVPGLGLRRGLARDTVIAPYASALALAINPVEAQANLKRLEAIGAAGRYGFWEAVDFTTERVPSDRKFAPVNAFMAHHQGMILCAIANILNGDKLVERFMRDPRIRMTELLLSERVPHELPAEIRRLELVDTAEQDAAQPRIRYSWTPANRNRTEAHVLGNGRLSTRISAAGAGGLRWNGQSITRFVPDATLDAEGMWFYLRDERSERVWSATQQPTGVDADEEHITFHSHKAQFHRQYHEIHTDLEVTVGANEDIELRRLVLTNQSERNRRLRLTTYAEIVLAPPLEDERHPAFSKLFVESEHLPEPGAVLFTRRARRPEDTPPVVLQYIIGPDGIVTDFAFETDRRTFIGRNRSQKGPLGASRPLSNSQGWTLDPVSVFQLSFDLKPGETAQYCLVTIAASSRKVALDVLERHATQSSVRWIFDDAEADMSRAIRRARIDPADLPQVQSLSSLLVYPQDALRAPAAVIRRNRFGQSNLWGLALSGDFPILLLRREIGEEGVLDTIIGAHQLWRRAGLEIDVVILQSLGSAYVEPLRDELRQLLQEIGATEMLGRPGGIHLAFADQIGSDQVRLLESMAWVILSGSAGSLTDQLDAAPPAQLDAPPIIPSHDFEPERERDLRRPDDLLFDNGFGGFTPDGREYLIHLEPGQSTPAPWVNVLANEGFGTLVTEAGGGFTWSQNSGEYRLTPWTNDAVSDRQTEVVYLRDEETAQVWSVTPDPAGRDAVCQIIHGAGYTEWRQSSRGIEQVLNVSIAHKAAIKIARLSLRNPGAGPRLITATYYAEWLLGSLPGIARRHVHTRFDHSAQTILATNPWSAEFTGRAAFLTANLDPHGFTTDRQEFLGRIGDIAQPAALKCWGLSGAEIAGGDTCAAYQVHVDLPPGKSVDVEFLLGEAENEAAAIDLAREWRTPGRTASNEQERKSYWDGLLGSIEITAPDPAMNVMVNRWLLYQSLSSRILARSGFYQASGAIGFRDQLQDALAFLHADPERTRAHILDCAAHQFEEGDVLHWWHPPLGRGVRTRCSDDLLWLPYAAAHYVNTTGDTSILDEEVPFLQAPPLSHEEHDRYALFDAKSEPRPLIDHCERALENVTLGRHGLPLIGAGDWNDGMDRVGDEGRGESVWLAWFASVCAASLAHCERRIGRTQQARHWAGRASIWRRNAEAQGWDGEWYRRAYDDEGTPLGSLENAECQIDSISQSWSVFAGPLTHRSRAAIQAAFRELSDDDAKIMRLLWPPFDKSAHDPGYIMAYPPGVRENGGQYSHAAAWLGLALARTGQGEEAHRIFDALNPVRHSLDHAKATLYRTEPYAVAADICSVGALRGRGGWSWYTGAAAWTWRLAVEGILGLTLRDGKLHIAPSLPDGWDGYEARLSRGGGMIDLRVVRTPHAHGRTTARLQVDGQTTDLSLIEFPPRGEVRKVIATIGEQTADQAEIEKEVLGGQSA
ncbi:cellobiose phosphorylase [Erythrobacter insulae]|uniref:Cellobiose phosphorylase n=1 Tax=Erythrobacter insulae TaxID=2584124 RepID=A0A547PBW0_9SPHN|nr:glucoamylase family protein [Erythrobacter insulae]TRD11625.1 cellobiose phosphorylase [Erythrobacter insulae]